MVERRIEKANKNAKSGDKKYLHEAEVFNGLLEHLNEGKSARSYECDPDDDGAYSQTSDLLTIKPVIYAANMDEDGIADYENNAYYQAALRYSSAKRARRCCLSAQSSKPEIASLEPDEREMFLEELGMSQSGLDRMIKTSYCAAWPYLLPHLRQR